MIGVRGGECGLEYWCEIQNHKKELSLNIREFRNFPGVSYVRAYVSCIFLHTVAIGKARKRIKVQGKEEGKAISFIKISTVKLGTGKATSIPSQNLKNLSQNLDR